MTDEKPRKAHDTHSSRKQVSGDTGGEKSGRQLQHGQPDTEGGRGSSMQGPKQDARGGPAGANQGGAPRGASRLEPSHNKGQQKKDRVTGKGKRPAQ